MHGNLVTEDDGLVVLDYHFQLFVELGIVFRKRVAVGEHLC